MRTLLLACTAAAAAACSDLGSATADLNVTRAPSATVLDPSKNPDNPAQVLDSCDTGLTYVGFGGMRLEVGRDEEDVGTDRDRVKPYSALVGEYARVLGQAPALLGTLSNTFGATPPRWYVEPEATAVSLYSSMRVAFVGCLGLTDGPDYDLAPTPEAAALHCDAFAQRFWSRSPDLEELDACVQVAVADTAREPEPRRKWAYACAAVLSSAPFLTF